MRRIIFLLLALSFAISVNAQTRYDTMSSTYYKENLGTYRLTTPYDSLDATPTDDTIYYYYPVLFYSKYTYYGTIALDTTAGNLGANAGTFVWQQSSEMYPDETDDKVWKNIGNAANLPATGASSTYSGTVDGGRLRLLVILTAGNAAIESKNIVKRT